MNVPSLQYVRFVFVALSTIALLSGCSVSDSRIINNAPGSIVVDEPMANVVNGGYCFYPEGANAFDYCGEDPSRLRQDGIMRYVPAGISAEHSIDRSASGAGFDYSVRWNYSPGPIADLGVSWLIHEDARANPNPAVSSWAMFYRELRILRTLPASEREFSARGLMPGRRYVYYLSASLIGARPSERVLVGAAMIYRRVVVDLSQVPVDEHR